MKWKIVNKPKAQAKFSKLHLCGVIRSNLPTPLTETSLEKYSACRSAECNHPLAKSRSLKLQPTRGYEPLSFARYYKKLRVGISLRPHTITNKQ